MRSRSHAPSDHEDQVIQIVPAEAFEFIVLDDVGGDTTPLLLLDFQPGFRAPLFHRGWRHFQQVGDSRHGINHSTVSCALVVVVDLQVNRAGRCFESLGDFPDAGGFRQLDDSGYVFLAPDSTCIRSAETKSFRQPPACLFWVIR
jgi:hypothetical protein